MCKLGYKVRNGHFYPHESPNFMHFKSVFSNKNFAFQFRLAKTYSLNPSLKNILELYIFEILRQETKRDTRFYLLFVKSRFFGNAKQTNVVFFRNI